MERFRSLFKIKKSFDEQQYSNSKKQNTDQIDRLIESDTHSDFLHPSQLELTTEQSKAENYLENSNNFEDRNDLPNNRSNLASDHIDDIREVSGERLQDQSHTDNAHVAEHTSYKKEEILQDRHLVQSNEKENPFEFNNELTITDLSQAVSSASNLGWMDFTQLTIEFEELAPSEQELNILLPEGSRLEDYASDLAFQYGHQRNAVKNRFLSVLEEFPHYQSYLAISRLVEKGFAIEIIQDAADLKSYWLSCPELWLRRVLPNGISDYANVHSHKNIRHQLTWETSARLCSIYGPENVVNLMQATWKNDWISLNAPERLSAREVKLCYWYFISFLNSKLVLNFSEFPIEINEQLLDDELTHFSIEEQKINLNCKDSAFGDGVFLFTPQIDGTIWQDEFFQKRKTNYQVEEE